MWIGSDSYDRKGSRVWSKAAKTRASNRDEKDDAALQRPRGKYHREGENPGCALAEKALILVSYELHLIAGT